MIKNNEKNLVAITLECKPGHPFAGQSFRVDHSGNPFQVPGIGGITLNVEAGDSCFDLEGDHIEPGVSVKWGDNRQGMPNTALQVLACTGNTATIMKGTAKGKKGVVLGTHGGSEHVIIDFDRKTKEKLSYDDKISIMAIGMGLKLTDFPTVKVTNLDPGLLKKLNLKVNRKTGKLQVPVTTLVPSEVMGSGIGSGQVSSGDYDIMTSCESTNKEFNLEKIRFGDFVALMDQDNRYGRAHRRGAVSIGIVIHSDCKNAGHGPGVTSLLTCPEGNIEPIVNSKANIADILKIGNKRSEHK